MKQTHGNRGKKYTTVFISKQSNKTISINETGNYYLKTKAVISGKAPVYKKAILSKSMLEGTDTQY